MTVKMAAARLEVSVSLVYALISEGRLSCSRHGIRRGCIRISEEQLAEYMSVAVVERPIVPSTGAKRVFKHIRLP